jgi:hypothetical protein
MLNDTKEVRSAEFSIKVWDRFDFHSGVYSNILSRREMDEEGYSTSLNHAG